MSWLDAHEAYVMEVIARDRVNDLRSTIDVAMARLVRAIAPTPAVPDAPRAADGRGALCPRALAKASR